MDDLLRTEKIGDKLVEVYPDYDAPDPREWDNLGTMVCWHKSYDLGDQQAPRNLGSEEAVLDFYGVEERDLFLPIYIYDHSGITVSTSPFGSRWDSGQVGWIFVKWEDYDAEGLTWQQALERLEAEVEAYDTYVRGDVYVVQVYELEKCNECGHVNQKPVDGFGGMSYDDVQEFIDGLYEQEVEKSEV